jgi:RNA polymerase II C-terminal domain phosphatase-like 3/4
MHASGHIEVSGHEAERLKASEVSRLISEQKLVLVLDLDHTLLNSVRLGDVSHKEIIELERIMASEAEIPRRLLYCLR